MPEDNNLVLADDVDDGASTPGESLEFSVVEIKEALYLVESAWSGIEIAVPKILGSELGVDPDRMFWVASPLTMKAYGIGWEDDESEIADLAPPPNREPGWKLDTKYPNRIRYWWGEEWDTFVMGEPRQIHAYKRVARGDDGPRPEPPKVNLEG